MEFILNKNIWVLTCDIPRQYFGNTFIDDGVDIDICTKYSFEGAFGFDEKPFWE